MKKIILELPSELSNLIDIDNNNQIKLMVENNKAQLLLEDNLYKPVVPIISIVVPSIMTSIIFFCFFFFKRLPQISLTGPLSIASLTLSLGLLSGMCSFILIFVKAKNNKVVTKATDIYWRNLPSVILSLSISLWLFLLAFFKLLGLMFKESSFDLYTSIFLFFIFVSIINYIMIYFALIISPSLLINLMTVVFISGIGLSMITNRDDLWWRNNFSFLGTAAAKNRWEFNLTLILTSILMIALIDYIFVYLNQVIATKKRLTTLKILLILTAVNLGAVGTFPYSSQSFTGQVHNMVAANLVYLIVLLIISIRWLLPQISKPFLTISYWLGGLLVLSCVLFQVAHYFSLTAFELISFLIAFTWILLLLKSLQNLTLTNEFNVPFTRIED
ncbi:DUF998 domain-containing protein [Vagococcus sp. BWB3-3]|uniref:DUF998 domain-containing protein n=1 Tax=Vagococcus allomyrinae TaxID=2794353 RepID=A0A940P9Y5_9ENTE|nr:DUF998 domain-containing protein [Vagococcus allomyrinae]